MSKLSTKRHFDCTYNSETCMEKLICCRDNYVKFQYCLMHSDFICCKKTFVKVPCSIQGIKHIYIFPEILKLLKTIGFLSPCIVFFQYHYYQMWPTPTACDFLKKNENDRGFSHTFFSEYKMFHRWSQFRNISFDVSKT